MASEYDDDGDDTNPAKEIIVKRVAFLGGSRIMSAMTLNAAAEIVSMWIFVRRKKFKSNLFCVCVREANQPHTRTLTR